MWCAVDNHKYTCVTYVQKDFKIQTFKAGIEKTVSRNCLKFHGLTKIVIL